MEEKLKQMLNDFDIRKTEVEESYRRGLITEYEYAMKLADLYDSEAKNIGLYVIYTCRNIVV